MTLNYGHDMMSLQVAFDRCVAGKRNFDCTFLVYDRSTNPDCFKLNQQFQNQQFRKSTIFK